MTLVRRAVDTMLAAGAAQVVVTVPAGQEPAFAEALAGLDARVGMVRGGDTRQDSVRLGLAELDAPADAVALVHDAARALTPVPVIRAVADAIAAGADAAIPVVAVVDSIRQVPAAASSPGDSVIVDRSCLRAVQTPQGARLGPLRAAHQRVADEGVTVTDDASVCEHAGLRVTLVEGHRDALKITEPLDLVVARAILSERTSR